MTFAAPGRRLLTLLAALSVVAVAACGSSDGVLTCGTIPEGGCPAGRGGSCDDTTCAGLYDCVDGAWTEVTSCDRAGTTSTGAASTTGAGGAGGCEVTVLDHTGESTLCTPDLLEPDCPAVAAEVCAPCETGCADFFLCTTDGWIDVAACEEDGTFVVIAR